MALESNDLMTLRSMGMTPYEQFKIGNMQSRKASGTAIGALCTAIGGVVVAVGAGLWAGSRAQNAKEVAIAKNDGLKDLVTTLASTLVAERTERIEGDRTLSISINDQVSGQQSGQLSQSQQLSNDIQLGLMTGKYSENPTKVQIYSAPQPCGCPGNCNG